MDPAAEACATLADRIRHGDAAAEEELVQTFASRVYAMAVARTRDREGARDLVQEVLWAVIQALRKGQLRDTDRLPAFVCGTARNQINNHRRSRARERGSAGGGSPLWPLVQPDREDEDERVELVRLAMAELDSTDRQVLHLTLVDGLKSGEISSRLGLAPDVVRQRKSRAVKRVAAILKGRSRT